MLKFGLNIIKMNSKVSGIWKSIILYLTEMHRKSWVNFTENLGYGLYIIETDHKVVVI